MSEWQNLNVHLKPWIESIVSRVKIYIVYAENTSFYFNFDKRFCHYKQLVFCEWVWGHSVKGFCHSDICINNYLSTPLLQKYNGNGSGFFKIIKILIDKVYLGNQNQNYLFRFMF